jgi:hypothetical protein
MTTKTGDEIKAEIVRILETRRVPGMAMVIHDELVGAERALLWALGELTASPAEIASMHAPTPRSS